MKSHLISKSLLAVAAAMTLGALFPSHTSSAASPQPNPLLDTRFVNLPAAVKEDECLARAKASLTALFKGNANLDIHAGSHTQVAATPDVIAQVECLQYSNVNAAYVLAAGVSAHKTDVAALAKITEALQKAVKGS
jgi:hypothetical protein